MGSICQFLECKYFLHGQLQAVNLTSMYTELGKDTYNGHPRAGTSQFQHTKFHISGKPLRILRKKFLYLIVAELDRPSYAQGLVSK